MQVATGQAAAVARQNSLRGAPEQEIAKHDDIATWTGDQKASAKAYDLVLPELPDDIRAIGVKLFGEKGLEQQLADTQCLVNGHVNFNVTMTLCGSNKDNSFVKTWFDEGSRDIYGLRRPSLNGASTFIDAGSFVGDSTIMMQKLHPEAKVYAFEVIPTSYFYLRWNIRLNGIRDLPCEGSPAGGGICAFNGPTGLGDGKELKMRFDPAALQGSLPSTSISKEGGAAWRDITVPTMTPAQLFKQANMDSVDFMKLDCQGCEWVVARNMMTAGLWSKVKNVGSETTCPVTELETMDLAALMARQEEYEVLKKKSGPYIEDTCNDPADGLATATIKAYNLAKEIAKRSK